METLDWYAPLRDIQSLGSQKQKIAHMGELSQARKKHLGQFFTTDDIVAFMWRFLEGLEFKSLLDNSIGSARMFQFARPGVHDLYGVDVHLDTVRRVMHVVDEAGFNRSILHAGMEDIEPKNFDVSLINPPFSIHLESQNLVPYEGCTCMGRLGPDTSAISDVYALRQALTAAKIVLAVMPTTKALEIAASENMEIKHRLCAIYHLPNKSFSEEGTDVKTSVMVFGAAREDMTCHIQQLESFNDEIIDFQLKTALEKPTRGKPTLGYKVHRSINPAINLPVTGEARVSVHLDGRRIKLKFFCGLVQAKVLNAIYVKRIFSSTTHRLPSNVKYAGQGRLDLNAYLISDDPLQAFNEFLGLIEANGGKPDLHPSVLPTLIKKSSKTKRALVPFRRTIWSKGNVDVASFKAISKIDQVVQPENWISPKIAKGEVVEFTKLPNGNFQFEKNGKFFELGTERIESTFDFERDQGGWKKLFEGKQTYSKQHETLLRKRAISLGLDKILTWKFQFDDLIEIFMQPRQTGTIVAWEQACGKSRLAACMILLSGVKHGLIVVEARLVDEMRNVLSTLPFDQSCMHVISKESDLDQLKKINIISYETLRKPVNPAKPKITYAKRLRRRISLVIPDEAEKICNMESAQTQALFDLSAKRKIPMTGTPIANYPRDVHGLMLFVGGDATPVQPYGYRCGYLSPVWLRSMEYTPRGIEQLAEEFVVLEWATHEFKETLSKGAKREVPKIKNLDRFRQWLSPVVKRRVVDEPEVQPYIKLPPIYEKVIELNWDPQHLAHYIKVADEFANWYKKENEGKRHNLAILLAKIMAVHMALNIPQADPTYKGGLTSKQKYQLERLTEIAEEGKKSLLFCNNPQVVDILHAELKKRNVGSVKFTGKQSIESRNEAKDELFKKGDTPHLLATLGCARSGQNLPQADYVLFYDRCWSFRTQDQAIKRPRRTERKEAVNAEFLHLPGSLDIYQAQLIAFKKDASLAGLDWATPELDDVEFLHLTTVLDRFVEGLAKLNNTNAHTLRSQLKAA